MTRILHVSDVYRPQIAGIELFVEELAQQQRAVGHDVTVLTSASGGGAVSDEEHVVRGSMLTLAGKVDFADYDVVHAHISVFSSASTLVTRAAVRAGTPVVATVHSMWAGPGSLFVPTAALIGGWRRAPIVWAAVSRAAAQDVRRALPDAEVHVVPNAVDVDWWRAGRDASEAMAETPARPLTIAAVMRLARRKRPLALIDAVDRVRAQIEVPFRLVIAGDGPQRRRCEVAVRVRGLEDVVEFAGSLPREGVRGCTPTPTSMPLPRRSSPSAWPRSRRAAWDCRSSGCVPAASGSSSRTASTGCCAATTSRWPARSPCCCATRASGPG